MNDMKFTLFQSQAQDSTSKETKHSSPLQTPGPTPTRKARQNSSRRLLKDTFQDKMAKVIEDCQGDEPIEGCPGQLIRLRWLIQNRSKRAWPRQAILKNVTTSEKIRKYFQGDNECPEQLLEKQLEAGEEYELFYDFYLPDKLPLGVYIFRFQLCDC